MRKLFRREKQILLAACVPACLVGAFAGYLGYSFEQEQQFHGGILDEDRALALWHLVWAALSAFAEVAAVAFLVLGVLPLVARRFLSGGNGSDPESAGARMSAADKPPQRQVKGKSTPS